jgi:hypothetical protein
VFSPFHCHARALLSCSSTMLAQSVLVRQTTYILCSLVLLQPLQPLKIRLVIIFLWAAVAGVWPGRFCIVRLR